MRDIPGVVLASVVDISETADASVPVWRLKFIISRLKYAVLAKLCSRTDGNQRAVHQS